MRIKQMSFLHLWLIVGLLSMPYGLLGADSEVMLLLKKGHKMREMGNQDSALSLYLKTYPLLEPFADTAEERIEFYQGMALLFGNSSADEMAIKYAKQAYSYEQNRQNRDALYLRAGQIATFYLNLHQLDSAEHYFRQALRLVKGRQASFYMAGAYNNLGMLKASIPSPDAKNYYDTALLIINQHHYEHRGIFASVHDNLAELFIREEKYELALEHCKIIENWLVGKAEETHSRRPINVKLKKAEALWKLNQLPAALTTLAEIEPLCIKPEFTPMKQKCYELYISIYKSLQSYQEMAAYQGKLLQLVKENLNQRDALTHKSLESISKMRAAIVQKELEYAQLRASLNKRWIILIVVCALLLVAANYFYQRKRIYWQQMQFLLLQNQKQGELRREQLVRENAEMKLKKEKFERENAEILLQKEQLDKLNMELQLKQEQAEKENIALSLTYRKKELANTLNYLSDGREWNENILERLTKINTAKEPEKATLVRETIMDIRNRLVVDDKLQVIHENMDVLNQEFYAKMRDLYPDLSLTELELCAYFRMNLANKDIASLRNTSLKAVQMARYRIRKKLNLARDTDIYAALQAI